MSRTAAGVLLVLMAAAASACNTVVEATEQRWLLIRNPRFGDVPSEVEYIWVEEDKVPTTFKTPIPGKRSLVAPPEIVARYSPPPGGGKISPRQGATCPSSWIQVCESRRHGRILIVHPVTGEVLGELDDPCTCSSD